MQVGSLSDHCIVNVVWQQGQQWSRTTDIPSATKSGSKD
jgi:hypothetical protein